jgi:hypothetical protein
VNGTRSGESRQPRVVVAWCRGFPPLLRLRDRKTEMWEGELGHDELHRSCPQPPPPFIYVQCDRGPQPSVGWHHLSGREIEWGLGLGPVPLDARWGQSNILPLDLNLILVLVFNLILKLSTHFIIDQYIDRLRHNSQLHTMRLNNYHVHFYSEIDSHII